MNHKSMTIGQLIQNGYNVLMENDKHVIHEKDGSSKLLAVVQMKKKETCFSSQVSVTSPKNSCILLHEQSTLIFSQ